MAWCSRPGRGARTIPAGSLTGVQVLKAPSYILFAGHIKQENVNIPANDTGGELDPHGADEVCVLVVLILHCYLSCTVSVWWTTSGVVAKIRDSGISIRAIEC